MFGSKSIKPNSFSEQFTLDTSFNLDDQIADAMNSGNYSQFTIQITDSGANASAHKIELFSPMRSAALVREASLNEGAYTAAFNFSDGKLVYTFGADEVTITCLETDYRGLFQNLQTTKLTVALLKYSCTSAVQANNAVEIVQKGVFGKTTSDKFIPSSYRKGSDNTAGLFYDIPLQLQIDNSIALQHTIGVGETVTMRLFVPNLSLPSNF